MSDVKEEVNVRKFKSASGKPVRVAGSSGHVVVIGAEAVDVPDIGDLHQKALLAGCFPLIEDEQPETGEALPPVPPTKPETNKGKGSTDTQPSLG